ncbi:MAG TPA: hypothetical protein VF070_25655 [Streptosporangiaceae bacterium]
MQAVTARGRWVWGVSGLATVVALAVPTVQVVTSGGQSWPTSVSAHPFPAATLTRTMTVPQLVTSVTVDTSGTPVRVVAGQVNRIEITETFWYDKQAGEPPAVTPSVSGGSLTLTDSACSGDGCGVGFSLIVPPGVAASVTTEGGDVVVSGTARTVVDSGGGTVRTTQIVGQLSAQTEGGPLQIGGLSGALNADTGGGPLNAREVTAATATVNTEGGDAVVAFAVAPGNVHMETGGGAATLLVPRGPYALTADTGGGEEALDVALDPAAPRSVIISTEGGPLLIRSPANGAVPAPKAVPPPPKP